MKNLIRLRRVGKVKLAACLFIPLLLSALASSALRSDTETNDPLDRLFDTAQGQHSVNNKHGTPTILSFFFESCGNACPVQTAKLAAVQRSLPVSVKENTRFISLSLQPLLETPASVEKYAQHYGIDTQHWLFGVNRSNQDLDDLLDRLSLETRQLDDGQIDHAMIVYLMSSDGIVIQRYIGHQFNETRVIQDLINLVHAPG